MVIETLFFAGDEHVISLDNAYHLLSGVGVTLTLTGASLACGLVFALMLSLMKESASLLLQAFANGLLFFIRGTPVLVQLFLVYYGLGQFEWLRQSFWWHALAQPMVCAILVLSINTGCYTSVILTGAIRAVPAAYAQGAYALGMSRLMTLRRVILPRAWQLALPAYSNEVLIVLKTTSLASVITLMDIMGVTQDLISQTYNTLYWYAVAGALYLVLNATLIFLFNGLSQQNHREHSV